ncbi:MAG: DUF1080 domain-containing protein [Kiritimatiellae bacterium]|nr:DUF1080 domain-containing protein [Kiritimatiellia bacterium]
MRAVALLSVVSSVLAASAVEPGFVEIFNGRDTSGWYGSKCYGVDPAEPGVLQCFPGRRANGDSGNLLTVRHYRNFVLRFDFVMPANGNNGLGVRINDPHKDAAFFGMCEIQLLDDGGSSYRDIERDLDYCKAYQYTGSVYGVVPCRRDNKLNRLWGVDADYAGGRSYLHKPGSWNQMEVRVAGEEIVVILNGHLITRANLSTFTTDGCTPDGIRHVGMHNARGSIGWQGHGYNFKWRNIRIRELADDAKMSELDAADALATAVPEERIGVCSWSYQKPLRDVAVEMKKIGVRGINLALAPFLAPDGRHGVAEGEEALAFARSQFASGEWKLMSTMISFPQEDYSTLETIRRTGGIVPDDSWPANSNLIARAAAMTKELGGRYLLLHAGFLDENDHAAYAKYLSRVRFIRDECAKHGVTAILESGQETADDLAKFLPKVPGVCVNFDPANMILYGKGNPVEALVKLRPWIVQLHIKDADATAVQGTWGEEKPWGEGQVDVMAFKAELKRLGYPGNYVIEREGGDDRAGDIAKAVADLK